MNPRYPFVAERANHRCEYCHAPEVVFNLPFEVEHIQPLSLGGLDDEINLALACRSCNLFKGWLVEAFDSVKQISSRLFNPRVDQWLDHFEIKIETGAITGRTEIGRVTTTTLRMNLPVQLIARRSWTKLGIFP